MSRVAQALGIAKWNGSSWSAVGGEFHIVYALAVFDDGGGPRLYAGGFLTTTGGVTLNNVAKWDGSGWSALGSGVNSTVLSLAVLDDGSGQALYAGGFFTNAGGHAANRVAKWDGSSWFALGSGMNREVRALLGFDDGSGPALIAGGAFEAAYDAGDSFLARWALAPDTTPPTLSCPPFVLVREQLGSPPGEVVTFSPTAADCRDPSPNVVCVPPSGSTFPPGTTLVTCTATDAAGNQATCQFPVTVARVRWR